MSQYCQNNKSTPRSAEKMHSPVVQCPIIGSIQKIVVYETASRLYLVGSNNTETRFKVIKIDRTEPKDLVISCDNLEYTRKETKDLLRMIDLGNRVKVQSKVASKSVGLKRAHYAFGVVGFVRFLEGYYMVLITKRRRVAEIATHTVYKVEDTSLVYIPNNPSPKNFHPDEQRYVKTFQNVDLSSNFYFSYSYDLTNSLQHNMSPCKLNPEDLKDILDDKDSPFIPSFHDLDDSEISRSKPPPNVPVNGPASDSEQVDVKSDGRSFHGNSRSDTESPSANPCSPSGNSPDVGSDGKTRSSKTSSLENGKDEVEDALSVVVNLLDDDDDDVPTLSPAVVRSSGAEEVDLDKVDLDDTPESVSSDDAHEARRKKLQPTYVGVKSSPCMKFVWNEHLLKNVGDTLQHDWILHVIHGFVGQSNINVYKKNIYLTLIARRSNRFAGTRFLKRGASIDGSVANEVETEQIVFDASLMTPGKVRFTSFVQMRGSIPLQWSQDASAMTPKPPINLDQSDPYGAVSGRHFNQLLSRFGSPIIVLDLVKKKEKRPHESILSGEFVSSIHFLNQFLPVEHRIKYIGYDMARISKKKNMDIFKRLDAIAEFCLQKTGFFQSRPGFYSNQLRPNTKCLDVLASPDEPGRRQHGVVRTNCIDCLDRTNTAQYAVGKCALAKQLYSLGVLDNLTLDYDSDCIRMMEHMYEDQGDTLALQYGGSQLVHRIKGYRKIAPWTSSSRDIMQTLSRYYNNNFSDSDKQNAINLFLGRFIPVEGQPSIWDLSTDFYLHNPSAVDISVHEKRSYSMWWNPHVLDCLPRSYHDESKGNDGKTIIIKTTPHDEKVNLSFDHYKPYELTTLDELFTSNMPNSIRDFMPKSSSNYSPFCARVRQGRKRDPYSKTEHEANPNVSGKDSTGSSTSTGSEGSLSGSEGSDIDWGDEKEEVSRVLSSLNNNEPQVGSSVGRTPEFCGSHANVSGEDAFTERYGVNIQQPSPESMNVYLRYVSCAEADGNSAKLSDKSFIMTPLYTDVSKQPAPSVPSRKPTEIYEEYVRRGRHGPGPPSERSMGVYEGYVNALKKGVTIDQRLFALTTSTELRNGFAGENFMGGSRAC